MIDELKNDRYINPLTDFGFKRLFGSTFNKDLLIGFLNALFDGHQVVKDITYLNPEQLGRGMEERHAIFDVYCENERGEKFIVEMQKAAQDFFKERSIYYASFPIQEQAQRGKWRFDLKGVYTIGILNFVFPDDEYDDNCFHHEVKLMDTADHHVFYDKLTFIYIELPKFNKTVDQLETMMDKWLYVLRNLSRLNERPQELSDRVFTQLFRQAEIAAFSPDDRARYQESVRTFRDIDNTVYSAHRRGVAEGVQQGIQQGLQQGLEQVATTLLRNGFSPEMVVENTGLTLEQVQEIAKNLEGKG